MVEKAQNQLDVSWMAGMSSASGGVELAAWRRRITELYCVDEELLLTQYVSLIEKGRPDILDIDKKVEGFIERIRASCGRGDGIGAFLQQYSLDTEEGIILMCLAEALLRIPDAKTADNLIRDRIESGEWSKHLGKSSSLFVNASTWGLMLTGKVVNIRTQQKNSPGAIIKRLINVLGEPVIRAALNQAMRIMGKQFVLGRTINEALSNSNANRADGFTHSYDMLGEAAMTEAGAAHYFEHYLSAINAIGSAEVKYPDVLPPSISIKLSALHPRYEVFQSDRVLSELHDRLLALVKAAKDKDVAVTIDAEEMDRLEVSLDLFEKVRRHPSLVGWSGLGMVVQAYSKRALAVLGWLTSLSAEVGQEIPVRLVKGAYWDSEIKWSQQKGLEGYPVFTRKAGTDVSYLMCASYLLSDATKGRIYPQFATHNAHTVSAIRAMAKSRVYEFQRLHGMGEELYQALLHEQPGTSVRVYAPVGPHKDLLPYLVRRLLENGANSSFVHKLIDPNQPVQALAQHPIKTLKGYKTFANRHIVLPRDLYGDDRVNSEGINLTIESQRAPLMKALEFFAKEQWHGGPIVGGETVADGKTQEVRSPYDLNKRVGVMHVATQKDVDKALDLAVRAFPKWRDTPVEQRAVCLEKMADLLQARRDEFIALCSVESGKCLQDGIDEVREAVDFCRYYAHQARLLMSTPEVLPGPTGESNELWLRGRGVMVCISPWNFPLAIFLGQVAAALVTGNTVLAKPAEQSCLIGFRAVQLLLEAGVPADVLHYLPGKGSEIGPRLTSNPAVAGVVFTGSTQTAWTINRSLAARDSAIALLIAETGGLNAMIADSTALPEQVAMDAVKSAFTSAGQRCSACRVIYVQADVADRVIELIKGAVAELSIGTPTDLKTDMGPVIDKASKEKLMEHIRAFESKGRIIAQGTIPSELRSDQRGYFVPPTVIKLDHLSELDGEKFGPILHLRIFKAGELDAVVDEINATGFGLTFGLHTRNQSFASEIALKLNVGNVYINRNQIGAIVGTQPFGGQGLSGTGPKAGGPHYLPRFCTEKTISNNLTAIGGNATLLGLGGLE